MGSRRILVVEDESDISNVLRDLLTSAGYDVTTTDSVFGAASLVRSLNPCAVLLDLGLPYRPGTSLLMELKSDPRTENVPVVIISGLPETLSAERRAMATAVLAKPLDIATLLESVRNACLGEGSDSREEANGFEVRNESVVP
jgi:DNA-binding response OmpR family regulator